MTIIALYRLYLQARALYAISSAPHQTHVVVEDGRVVSHSHERHPRHSSSYVADETYRLIKSFDRMSYEQKIAHINTDTVFLRLIERMNR